MNELVKVVKTTDKGYVIVVNEKAKKLLKEEHVAEAEYLIEELINELEYCNLDYEIKTEGFEVILQAKPKQDMYDVNITVEFGKETYIKIGKYDIMKDEETPIFTFMFAEPVLVKIFHTNDISLTAFDGKTKYNAVIPRLEQITIRIDLKDQFITLYIN